MEQIILDFKVMRELRLTTLQYLVAELIRLESRNGWCDVPKSIIEKTVGMSNRGVWKVLDRLGEMGYIEKMGEGHNDQRIRTTDNYNKHMPRARGCLDENGDELWPEELPQPEELPPPDALFRLAGEYNENAANDGKIIPLKDPKVQRFAMALNEELEKNHYKPIDVLNLKPWEWKSLREIARRVRSYEILPDLVGILMQMGGLGQAPNVNLDEVVKWLGYAMNVLNENIKAQEFLIRNAEDESEQGTDD